jgi:uncharacterized coiled-coil DUF342 family protein
VHDYKVANIFYPVKKKMLDTIFHSCIFLIKTLWNKGGKMNKDPLAKIVASLEEALREAWTVKKEAEAAWKTADEACKKARAAREEVWKVWEEAEENRKEAWAASEEAEEAWKKVRDALGEALDEALAAALAAAEAVKEEDWEALKIKSESDEGS